MKNQRCLKRRNIFLVNNEKPACTELCRIPRFRKNLKSWLRELRKQLAAPLPPMSTEDSAEKVNFRVQGRLPHGQIRRPADANDVGTNRPTIPSKLETILYKGDRETLGFGSKDLRFAVRSCSQTMRLFDIQVAFYYRALQRKLFLHTHLVGYCQKNWETFAVFHYLVKKFLFHNI